MHKKTRMLFLSANPWTTSRILVDEEEREVFEKLREGPYRDKFDFYTHAAIRTTDLQRFLMMYKPHIVHFSGHGSKSHRIIVGGAPGRGKEVEHQGLVQIFSLYRKHVRLAFLNACFTKTQARALSGVIDYSVGAGKGIGDKGGVAFAGAFYRALGFGMSVKEAFESAQAEIALTKMPRTKGFELFVRDGVDNDDLFPCAGPSMGGEPTGLSRLKSSSHSNNDDTQGVDALVCEELVLQSMKRNLAEYRPWETGPGRCAAKYGNPAWTKGQIEARPPTYSCVYSVVTVEVRRVLLKSESSGKKMAPARRAPPLRTRSGRKTRRKSDGD